MIIDSNYTLITLVVRVFTISGGGYGKIYGEVLFMWQGVCWVGDNETDEYFETVYSCNNCGAEIVIYKELSYAH